MRNAMISGLGFHVPERVVTNNDLITQYGIDTTHEWILKRTGIEERRFVADGEGSVEISVPAAERAIADSGLDKSDIEMIVYATMSSQHAFPGNGPFLQHALGMNGVPTMDIRNQCTGYLYALATADSMIKAGLYRHVLVVGCDVHSTALDLVFFHQANLRINQYVAKQLGLSDEQVPHNIERYGNTTAGTLPILMTEMVQAGRLKPGMKVGLAAFGSGFTWGAAIIDW